jgi:hypothetical protein
MINYTPKKTVNKVVRRWLNPATYGRGGTTGGLIYHAVTAKKGCCFGLHCYLEMRDCYKRLEFDMEIDTPKDKRKTMRKLEIMIEELQALRATVDSVELVREEDE